MSDTFQSIQYQFDLILFEEGIFSSIAWLLRAGHLDYVDYQNWRKGEIPYLEDHFKTDPAEIIAGLKLAKDYAKRLKLDSFCQPYTSVAQQTVNISRSAANERILTTVYQPAEDRVQMDLFFDSAPVFAVQDLIRAIVDKREEVIPRLLTQLQSLDPEKFRSFDRLLAQPKQLMHYHQSQTKIEFLLNTMTPLAFNVLGRFASDFLIPFWQQLSLDISRQSFDAGFPENHLSFTAFKAYQWGEVIASIEREDAWDSQPILLFRYAEACFKLNMELAGLASWFRLFMLVPESAERLVEDTGNYLLLSDWRNFNELDPELEPLFFPAWMVLKKPALANLKVVDDGKNAGYRLFQLISSLGTCMDNGINETTIKLRARLREQSASLFDHYMKDHRDKARKKSQH